MKFFLILFHCICGHWRWQPPEPLVAWFLGPPAFLHCSELGLGRKGGWSVQNWHKSCLNITLGNAIIASVAQLLANNSIDLRPLTSSSFTLASLSASLCFSTSTVTSCATLFRAACADE